MTTWTDRDSWAHFDSGPTESSGNVQLRFTTDGKFTLYHTPVGGRYGGRYEHTETWDISIRAMKEFIRQLQIVLAQREEPNEQA